LITSHVARKTFISVSLELGIPERVVKNISNHKDERSFRRYVKLEGSYLSKEMTKWNKGA
jgi:integrase